MNKRIKSKKYTFANFENFLQLPSRQNWLERLQVIKKCKKSAEFASPVRGQTVRFH